MSTFFKVTFLSYFNVAIVVMLVNFDLPSPILNEVGVLKGEFKDFSERWYAHIGANVCYTLIMMIFTPQIGKFWEPIHAILLRFHDRGYQFDLRRKLTVEEKEELKKKSEDRDLDSE